MKFDGVNLIVKDIEKQKKFYRDVLGFGMVSDYGDAVFFEIDGKKLGLFAKGHHPEGDKSLEGATKGLSHLEFSVPKKKLQSLKSKLEDAGFLAYGDVFKDADGNLFHFNVGGAIRF